VRAAHTCAPCAHSLNKQEGRAPLYKLPPPSCKCIEDNSVDVILWVEIML
jgi:hypothetical protein